MGRSTKGITAGFQQEVALSLPSLWPVMRFWIHLPSPWPCELPIQVLVHENAGAGGGAAVAASNGFAPSARWLVIHGMASKNNEPQMHADGR